MANVQGLRDYVGACLYHSAYTFNSIPCFFLNLFFVCLGFISFFCNKLIINMKKLNLFYWFCLYVIVRSFLVMLFLIEIFVC